MTHHGLSGTGELVRLRDKPQCRELIGRGRSGNERVAPVSKCSDEGSRVGIVKHRGNLADLHSRIFEQLSGYLEAALVKQLLIACPESLHPTVQRMTVHGERRGNLFCFGVTGRDCRAQHAANLPREVLGMSSLELVDLPQQHVAQLRAVADQRPIQPSRGKNSPYCSASKRRCMSKNRRYGSTSSGLW